MPAERTRGARRTEADGTQLVWTMPVEPTSSSGISFATNVTPVSFCDEMPPLVEAPPLGEFILFPPADDSTVARRPAHTKKKPENHIPRPPNAFILFRSSFIKSQHVSTEVETNHSTLSKIIGLTWQNLPDDERQVWHAKAKAALEEHKRKYPKYAFRPLQTRTKGGTTEKRKVREVEPKDLKRCAKIAELLVEGKKGQELDAAIQEFDKHHVPEIITRFEAPITARAYRRSSSAPIPDTEHSQGTQQFIAQTGKKVRAASTRPTRCSTPLVLETQSEATTEANIFDLQMKQEPSFDFSSFSFDGVASPTSNYECDPLTESFPGQHMYPSPLTIDTSFMEDWATQCSSPMSPSMPETPSYASPSPAPSFQSFGMESFDHTLLKPFDEFSAQFDQAYEQPQSSCGYTPTLVESFGGHSDYSTFAHAQTEVPLSNLNLDFSAFMSSLPQYSF